MRKQKCSLKLYSEFFIANQNRYSGVELSKVSPAEGMRHDSISRWLSGSNFTPQELWNQVKPLAQINAGYLIEDDSVLDKQYLRINEPAKTNFLSFLLPTSP